MSRLGTLGARLYRGEVSYDFIAHRKVWYAVSAALLVVSIVSLLTVQLTLGIEFRGGAEFRVKSPSVTQDAVRSTVSDVVDTEIVVQSVGPDTVRAQTETLTIDEAEEVRNALAKEFGVSRASVSTQVIGPSWGKDISEKALRALIFFLIGVVVFLSLYFEWKMALAAMIALLHDLVITAGLYSLIGFEVTPATVIGVLTILGYSLYDTVVVYDKIRENTRNITGSNRQTYSDAANLAVNQTVVRSVNTTLIALLPVGAILFVGVWVLGSGPLKDLSLALFVGIAVGAYSSIFIAPALLAMLKEREPAMRALARRVRARQASVQAEPVPAGVAAGKASAGKASGGASGGASGDKGSGEPDRPQDKPAAKGKQAKDKPAKDKPAAPRPATAGSITLPARPMKASTAGRPQPTRKPRSKRGK